MTLWHSGLKITIIIIVIIIMILIVVIIMVIIMVIGIIMTIQGIKDRDSSSERDYNHVFLSN